MFQEYQWGEKKIHLSGVRQEGYDKYLSLYIVTVEINSNLMGWFKHINIRKTHVKTLCFQF